LAPIWGRERRRGLAHLREGRLFLFPEKKEVVHPQEKKKPDISFSSPVKKDLARREKKNNGDSSDKEVSSSFFAEVGGLACYQGENELEDKNGK